MHSLSVIFKCRISGRDPTPGLPPPARTLCVAITACLDGFLFPASACLLRSEGREEASEMLLGASDSELLLWREKLHITLEPATPQAIFFLSFFI